MTISRECDYDRKMTGPRDDFLENMTVLVVEDDKDIARILRQYAESHGANVCLAHDGDMAITQHGRVRPDIVLLDVNLPKRDGFEVLKKIRTDYDTPTIILSARIEDEDKLEGLGLGADDYVVKPFNPREVMARVKVVLHRTIDRERPDFLRHSGVIVNLATGEVSFQHGQEQQELQLTPSEYKILILLMGAPNKVFSREDIQSACFPDSDALARTVDSHVSHLRKKLMAVSASDLISVSRGLGYRFGEHSSP